MRGKITMEELLERINENIFLKNGERAVVISTPNGETDYIKNMFKDEYSMEFGSVGLKQVSFKLSKDDLKWDKEIAYQMVKNNYLDVELMDFHKETIKKEYFNTVDQLVKFAKRIEKSTQKNYDIIVASLYNKIVKDFLEIEKEENWFKRSSIIVNTNRLIKYLNDSKSKKYDNSWIKDCLNVKNVQSVDNKLIYKNGTVIIYVKRGYIYLVLEEGNKIFHPGVYSNPLYYEDGSFKLNLMCELDLE